MSVVHQRLMVEKSSTTESAADLVTVGRVRPTGEHEQDCSKRPKAEPVKREGWGLVCRCLAGTRGDSAGGDDPV